MAVAPVAADEFAVMMADLGPFEPAPELAVAVSGGRDSLALALLAQEWAIARGGSLLALTVDHGLRADSTAEARRVAAWLRALGIRHRILCWRGNKPKTAIQEAARRVRYRLLETACRNGGILHLLLGHQRQDQIATHLMRQARDSGPYGLAGMAALRSEGGVRLVRPLLGVDRERLTATLEVRGQPWIDDPSNVDPSFERSRIERRIETEAPAHHDRARLAEAARQAGLERAAMDRQALRLAAESVQMFPAGFALLTPEALRDVDAAVRSALLRRLIMTVGGRAFPPRQDRLARFVRAFEASPVALHSTLGSCRIAPWRGRLVFSREFRRLDQRLPVVAGSRVRWDRFECCLAPGSEGAFAVTMLGSEGWRRIRGRGTAKRSELPAQVPAALPALWDASGPVVVPHLGYRREDRAETRFSADFRPPYPLAAEPFAVASAVQQTI